MSTCSLFGMENLRIETMENISKMSSTEKRFTGTLFAREEADALFWADVEKFVRGVNRLKQGTRLTQNQFDALVSFSFNCGLGALERSTLLKKVKRNPNDPTIEDAFKAYRYVNKVENAGLLARRQKESNLYFA